MTQSVVGTTSIVEKLVLLKLRIL